MGQVSPTCYLCFTYNTANTGIVPPLQVGAVEAPQAWEQVFLQMALRKLVQQLPRCGAVCVQARYP